MNATPLKIVAAIPCFNTEPFIVDVISKAMKYVNQVVVIDDGSHDGTAEAARRAGATVISHVLNRGYGEAIKSCFEAAKANGADILVILDGDGQHDSEETPRLLAPIVRGEADLIIGSRFLPPPQQTQRTQRTQRTQATQPTQRTQGTQPTQATQATQATQPTQGTQRTVMPPYRRFGINVITSLWNFGCKVKVSDTQSGFRAYSRKAFQSLSLSETGMAVSIEILEKVRRKRAVITEVPISCSYVASTLNRKAIRHGLGVALAVLRIRLKNSLVRGDNA